MGWDDHTMKLYICSQSLTPCFPRKYPKMPTMRSLAQSVGAWTTVSARRRTIPTSLKQLEVSNMETPSHSTASPKVVLVSHLSSMFLPCSIKAKTSTSRPRFFWSFLSSASLASMMGLISSRALATQVSLAAIALYCSMGLRARRHTKRQARTMVFMSKNQLQQNYVRCDLNPFQNQLRHSQFQQIWHFYKEKKNRKYSAQGRRRVGAPVRRRKSSTKSFIIASLLLNQNRQIIYKQDTEAAVTPNTIHTILPYFDIVPCISLSYPIENKYNSTAMNQRATHFNLGSTSQNYGSVYAKDYVEKQPDPNDSKGPNPFRSSSLNGGQKGVFNTTNKMLYRAWQNVEKAKLDDQKLHDLRTHHFKLGSYNPNEVRTTNKIYYDHKELTGDAAKTQEESKNKMRAHNHDFKEQNFTNYKSAYAHQYTPKDGEYAGRVQVHAQNAIVFGNHQIPLVTTSNTSFTPKSVEPPLAKLKNQSVQGISLGDKPQPMETMNQQFYNRKEIIKSSLPESTMRQLRNTHFNLGLMPPQYQTENDHYAKAQNNLKEGTGSQLTFQIPVYESGTWVDKQARFNGATTNKRDLPARVTKPFERAVQVTRSGIALGGHSSNYQSEFKDGFTVPTELDRAVLQINKKGNIVIGTNGGNYITEHKSSYKTNDLSQCKVDIDIKKLVRQDHFHLGGSLIEPKVTIYQDEHRKDQQNKNKVFHKTNI